MRQFSSAHTLRGPTAERKKSRTNWKNINKEPNPAKQEKAELKRERRRSRNIEWVWRTHLGKLSMGHSCGPSTGMPLWFKHRDW